MSNMSKILKGCVQRVALFLRLDPCYVPLNQKASRHEAIWLVRAIRRELLKQTQIEQIENGTVSPRKGRLA